MNKDTLEIKEFDKITCNEKCKNCISEEVYKELDKFIREYTSKENDEEDISKFIQIGYRKDIGDYITVKNYVGLIQLKSGFQIEILPKIFFEQNEDNNAEETKKIFLKMLRTLKDFPSKVFSTANLKMDRMNLYEIFINMYMQEVIKLVKKGIKSSYIVKQDNQNFFKGKLLVNEHIKNNIVHKEKFFVEYDEFLENRPENRLIKSTLLKLQKISKSAKNQKEIKRILVSFELVQESANYAKDFSKVIIDRNTKDYDIIMKWSKVYLLNKSFSTFSGGTQARALLFPMEKVFEAYIANELKKKMQNLECKIYTQDSKYHLFDDPKKFLLKPDIVVKYKEEKTIILDTKWKRLENNKTKNYGISQEDMYQMYAYAKKYNSSEIWLIYPLNEEFKGNEDILFKTNDNGKDIKVKVYFADLSKEDCLDNLKNKLEIL